MAATETTALAAPPAAYASPAPPRGEAFARLAPWMLVLFAAVMASLAPLYEMDLAQHLASGEWIVRHGAVPFIEPWAWTRAGQPYFAYSWMPQVLFFGLLRAFGPVALHLLEGAIAAAAVGAALWMGRQLRWPRAAVLTVAVLNLLAFWALELTLRPQQILFVAIPLAWGVAARIREHGPRGRDLLALAGVGALAANTHIFFPLTAVPLAYFLLAEGSLRTWAIAGAVLLAGWLIGPYGLDWYRVFALNFGHNALLGRPTSVSEFRPGFEYWSGNPAMISLVVALLAAPWLTGSNRPTRERAVLAVFWSVGLVLFAYAGRLILVWWALALPLAGAAVTGLARRAALSSLRRSAGLMAGGLALIVLLAAAPDVRPVLWRFEGDAVHRMLPRAADDPALWLPSWLLCHTRPGAQGRIFTEFNYGSELNWRLPGYSPSIDGRTIFPDSDALEFAFTTYGHRRTHATTWRSADLAMIGRTFWLAPVLDANADWVFLAQSGRDGSGVALWARREWWQRWGDGTPLPVLELVGGDERAICPTAGTFPKP